MKAYWHKIRYILFAAAWFVAGILFVFFIGAADRAHSSTACTGIDVQIENDNSNHFVTEEEVLQLVLDHMPAGDLNAALGAIDLERIENMLKAYPYIEHAEVSINIHGKMKVMCSQRSPLLRIINAENQSYYISSEGLKIPTIGSFTSRVPVATGHIADNGRITGELESKTLKSIYRLGLFLQKSDLWRSLVEQVYVEQNGDMVIVPKIGDHTILIGNEHQLTEKFEKLKIFYEEAMDEIGWKTYEKIDLRFKDQLVCTKR